MTRFGYVMTAYAATLATTVAIFIDPPPRLVWNASASAPIGLYAVRRNEPARVGDLVLLALPERVRRFLTDGGYLPANVPVLKHVAALAGQRICRAGLRITVDGAPVGEARRRDSRGRTLPDWQGCVTLGPEQVFLMNTGVPDSLDGRYFGPLPATAMRGRLIPVLTDPDGAGRFNWRAPSDQPRAANQKGPRP